MPMVKHSYQQANFWTSAAKPADLPPDRGKEVAFAGRSNAGKSSVINRLTRQKQLARTSKTPGRTQLINFFQLEQEKFLVDLPGYGYAKVPNEVKKRWQKFLECYLTNRRSLTGLVLVMDIRHPLTDFDKQLITWCQQSALPLHVLLNKADKLKYGAQCKALHHVESHLSLTAITQISLQLFSASTGDGLEGLEQHLDLWYN